MHHFRACRPASPSPPNTSAHLLGRPAACSAVRSQQFIAATARDLQQRAAKAAALEAALYPDTTKRLPPQTLESFFQRLMDDTQRRAQNKCVSSLASLNSPCSLPLRR